MEQAALPWAIIMSLFVPAVAWWVKGQASEVTRTAHYVTKSYPRRLYEAFRS
jgi:hypothetical protein